jgi:hypothetical protein
MEAWKKALVYVACGGLFVTWIPVFVLPVAAQQAAVSKQQESPAAQPGVAANDGSEAKIGPAKISEVKISEAKISELPDSPGATLVKSDDSARQQSAQLAWNAIPSPSQSAPQETQAQPQPSPQKPVGTAVAEAPPASGVAASQPAGVAIAPAKQRRVRTIVLRMGAIVGAGVAVGSVVALTAATSSKPPGAH